MKMTYKKYEIEVYTDLIDVTPIMEPDPNWKYKCGCEVIHKWHSDNPEWPNSPGLCETELPTLKYIIDVEPTEDLPGYGHYECTKCGEEISPGERSPNHRYSIPGRRSIHIDGKPATEQEVEKLIKELE